MCILALWIYYLGTQMHGCPTPKSNFSYRTGQILLNHTNSFLVHKEMHVPMLFHTTASIPASQCTITKSSNRINHICLQSKDLIQFPSNNMSNYRDDILTKRLLFSPNLSLALLLPLEFVRWKGCISRDRKILNFAASSSREVSICCHRWGHRIDSFRHDL